MALSLSDLLSERQTLLADGALGTNFFAMGLEAGEAPELWNLTAPDKVRRLHQSFVDAGSDLILTNSFGGTASRLKLHDAENRVSEINRAAAKLAREVSDKASRPVLVAGSLGPTGELFAPLGTLEPEQGRELFRAQAEALVEGGVHLLWIETLSSAEELRAAVAGAAGLGLPIVATLSFDSNGRTMMGIAPEDWIALQEQLSAPLYAYGANCGAGLNELVAAMLAIRQAAPPDAILIGKGNCGIPRYEDGRILYDGTPELMADYARLLSALSVQIIGGCCGTTARHIAAMRQALDKASFEPVPDLTSIEARLGALNRSNPDLNASSAQSKRRRRQRR